MVFPVSAGRELAECGLGAFFVNGWERQDIRDKAEVQSAMDGVLPHKDFSLVLGSFDGGTKGTLLSPCGASGLWVIFE